MGTEFKRDMETSPETGKVVNVNSIVDGIAVGLIGHITLECFGEFLGGIVAPPGSEIDETVPRRLRHQKTVAEGSGIIFTADCPANSLKRWMSRYRGIFAG